MGAYHGRCARCGRPCRRPRQPIICTTCLDNHMPQPATTSTKGHAMPQQDDIWTKLLRAREGFIALISTKEGYPHPMLWVGAVVGLFIVCALLANMSGVDKQARDRADRELCTKQGCLIVPSDHGHWTCICDCER